MRKFALTVIVLAIFAISANAQVSKPFSLYLGGGVTLPNSPDYFKEGYKMGFHGTGGVGLKLIPLIEVVGKVEYHSFSLDDEEFLGEGAEDVDISGGTLTAILYGADARLALNVPGSPMKPFVLAGAGFASLSTSSLKIDDEEWGKPFESKTKFYFNVGAGLEIGSLFIQGRYVSISSEEPSEEAVKLGAEKKAIVSIPITLGIKF
jgi:opacity protein-like surface antigen